MERDVLRFCTDTARVFRKLVTHGRTARCPNHIPHIKSIHGRVRKDNGIPCFAKRNLWVRYHTFAVIGVQCTSLWVIRRVIIFTRKILQRLRAVYRGMDSPFRPFFRSFGSSQGLVRAVDLRAMQSTRAV